MAKSLSTTYATMDIVSKLARHVGDEIDVDLLRNNTQVAAWLSIAEMALQGAYQAAGASYFDAVGLNYVEFIHKFTVAHGEKAAEDLKTFMADYEVEVKQPDTYERDLPKNCLECEHFGGDPGIDCTLIGRCFSNYDVERPRMCPLAIADEDERDALVEKREKRIAEAAVEMTYDFKDELDAMVGKLEAMLQKLDYTIK